ncbi:MAG: hypothetical protein OEN02_09495 [Gammaproteobacteria bacterium]|nr:hypothetical protein [Gammaproteobacteria bacterium]
MQCYQYLAATTSIANALDSIPGASHKLPFGVVADWMDENNIEAEDVLLANGDEVRAIVENLIQSDQPDIPHAA